MSDDDEPTSHTQEDAANNIASLRDSIVFLNNQGSQSDAEELRENSIDRERKYVHLAGLQDHYKQKGNWSRSIGVLMFILVIFQCFLLWKVGTGAWNFERYQWLLPALLIQNFGQVVGLALIVVKSLFSDIRN